jgi:hypothetical protein
MPKHSDPEMRESKEKSKGEIAQPEIPPMVTAQAEAIIAAREGEKGGYGAGEAPREGQGFEGNRGAARYFCFTL